MKTLLINTLRKSIKLIFPIFLALTFINLQAQVKWEKDVITTSAGPAEITFIGHGSLMISFQEKVIHIDPYSKIADYATLPMADFILITHEHPDHLDLKALALIKKADSRLIYTEKCSSQYLGGIIMKNGESQTFDNIKIEAVPAYNIVNKGTQHRFTIRKVRETGI